MRDLRGEELEEAVELVRITPKRRGQRRGIGVLRGLDRTHLYLELASEALDATEDAHGVPLAETLVEQVDVVPDAGIHSAARVRELEREVCGPRAGPPTLLPGHGEYALDGPVLDQLGDRGHVSSLWREAVGTLAAMVDVQPFRAVRYAGAAGVLADLVAPPYDAVDDDERAALYMRSPYNVLHVTLPESADEAGLLYREWRTEGILVEDDEPAIWLAVEDYVGPDGVARERHGAIVSVAAEPYERGVVLPHEQTHAAIRADRLALLRATRVQPEPILLLADTPIGTGVPERDPDLEVDGTRLWRVPTGADSTLDAGQLLIADGHHRYESAVELGRELGGNGARIMALVVSTDDSGLQIFPTHRLFTGRPDLAALREGEACRDLDDAMQRLAHESYERSVAIAYRRGHVELVKGAEGEVDTELVDRHGLDGIRYTQRSDEAVASVDRGDADVAFVLRQPRVEAVFDAARRARRMPPKSTYFYPKPLSGLLFHPVTA